MVQIIFRLPTILLLLFYNLVKDSESPSPYSMILIEMKAVYFRNDSSEINENIVVLLTPKAIERIPKLLKETKRVIERIQKLLKSEALMNGRKLTFNHQTSY